MRWFFNLSLRYKAIIPLGIIAVVMAIIVTLAIFLMADIGTKVHKLSEIYLPSVNYLTQADRDMHRAVVDERSLLFLDVDDERFKETVADHEQSVKDARDHVDRYAAIVTDAKSAELLKQYDALRDRWEQITNEIVKQRADDTRVGRSTAIDLSFKDGSKVFKDMRAILAQLTEQTVAASKAAGSETEKTVNSSRVTLITCLIIGLSMCAILAILLPRMIANPIIKVIKRLEDLADGNGDLTARLTVDSRDEVGQLADVFNRFVEKLQLLIREISNSTKRLLSSADKLGSVAAESNQVVREQQGGISQIVTAMHEMTATAQDVARNANSAAGVTRQVSEGADDGKAVVNDAVKAIGGLADEIVKAADVIQNLSKESEQIGSVLVVIKGVADQTNLLALNAAIEAARAGEQGRGFAVVADEVRTLASRTQGSTQEIEGMIARLQELASNAVKVMEESRAHAGEGVSHASKAGDSFDAIVTAIATINDMNTQIASAAEEQTSVSDEISRNVLHINDFATRSAETAEQTQSAGDEVTQLARTLQQQVSRFKV
jgi:methyl-accepting chemotaxis protein